MTEEAAKSIERYIKNMPSLPTSISKVLEVGNDPDASPVDLNQIISLDPVLMGRVLKLINSAYYGLEHRVTSLVKAITMLGINTIKNLVLSTAVMQNMQLKKNSPGLDVEGFWRHSLCVGVAAKQLAKKRKIDPKLWEEYFTAGLLHDLGKIPLNVVKPEECMLAAGAAANNRKPLFWEEGQAMGINHCEAGALIVKAWQLEGPVGDAVIYHHNSDEYSGAHKDLLYSIIAANFFACSAGLGFSGDRFPRPVEQRIWRFLQVPGDVFDPIKMTVHSEIEKAAVFLNI
ncbi:histidine kinase [Spirochaetia bacterium]|nr:histidine kinase [Spirochaetia bacterium]